MFFKFMQQRLATGSMSRRGSRSWPSQGRLRIPRRAQPGPRQGPIQLRGLGGADRKKHRAAAAGLSGDLGCAWGYGRPSWCGTRKAHAQPSRQALDRRAAVPEPERRSGAGVLRRRHGGGHHHGVVADAALLQKWIHRVAVNMRRWVNANSRSDTRSETGRRITGRWSVEGG